MDEQVCKFICDMLQAVAEIETATERFGRQYEVFESDVVFRADRSV